MLYFIVCDYIKSYRANVKGSIGDNYNVINNNLIFVRPFYLTLNFNKYFRNVHTILHWKSYLPAIGIFGNSSASSSYIILWFSRFKSWFFKYPHKYISNY